MARQKHLSQHSGGPDVPHPELEDLSEPMGYRERGLWVSLGAVALVDTLYFLMVVIRWGSGEPLSAQGLLALLVTVVLILLIIEAGFLLANRAQKEPMDERDQRIAGASARLAYAVFVACSAAVLVVHLLNDSAVTHSVESAAQRLLDVPFVEVHLLLGALVSAELVRYGSALFWYRRGL